MPLSVVALLIGGVIGVVLGGDLRNVRSWQLRSWGLLLPGVALPVAADHGILSVLGPAMVIAGYLSLVVLAARNALLVGMGVIGVGLLANLSVVAADGGMPVQPASVVSAGLAGPAQLNDIAYGHRHHLQTDQDQLSFLDDRVPLRAFHQVLSIGDLILCVGVADMAANLVRRPRGRRITSVRPAYNTAATPSPGKTVARVMRGGLDQLSVLVVPPVLSIESGSQVLYPCDYGQVDLSQS